MNHGSAVQPEPLRFLVVGAGPAGATLALLLARNGHEVVLLEREERFERVFRGEGLMPSGMDALIQLGLGDALQSLPGEVIEAWEIFIDGRRAMEIPETLEALGPRAFRIVSPGHLIELLASAAARFSGFELRRGVTLRELERDPNDRVIGARVAGPEGEERIRADFVIGTDGRASAARKRAGIELALVPEAYDVLWFKAEPHPEQRRTLQLCASGAEAVVGHISWDGRWQLGWLIERGSWQQARRGDWLGAVAALLPEPLSTHLLAQRDAIEPPVLLDVMVGRVPRWHAPGLLLLGDAAHPMSPVRAQGLNLALRDALVAGNHLVRAARERGSLDAAAAAIQSERELEISQIQTLQYRELAGQRWAREHPRLMTPMLGLMSRIARAKWFGPLWLRQQAPFRFGVTEVRLQV